MNLKPIDINGKLYYFSKDLHNEFIFYSCGTSNHKLIKNRNLIEDVDYNYFKIINGNYVITKSRTRTTILMITKDYVDNFNLYSVIKPEPKKINLDNNIFTDDTGLEFPLEIRQSVNGLLYFLASDVEKILNLETFISCFSKKNKFKRKEHYEEFYNKEEKKIRMFLTMNGLLLTLYNTRSKKANNLVFKISRFMETELSHNVSNNELFSYGLDKSKIVLFSSVCNVPLRGIYIIFLGEAKDIKQSLRLTNLNNEFKYVCKFGLSEDIFKRYLQHEQNFQKLGITNIRLLTYFQISDSLMKAETSLKNYLITLGLKISDKEYLELAAFNKWSNFKTQLDDWFRDFSMTKEIKTKEIRTYDKEIINELKENYQNQISLMKSSYENQIKLLEAQLTISKLKYKNKVLKIKTSL